MTKSLYQPEEAKGIWVYLEHDGKTFEGVSVELLGKAKELAKICQEPLIGLLLGHGTDKLAEEVLNHGVDEVLAADDPSLEHYRTDPHTQAAAQIILAEKPNIFLAGATTNGRDLAGRLAVKLRTGLSADCTNFEITAAVPDRNSVPDVTSPRDFNRPFALERGALRSGKDKNLLLSEVTGFGGGIAAMIACEKHRPQMATVRPGVFEPSISDPAKRKGKIRKIAVTIDASKVRTEIVERKVHGGGVDITKAKYLVCGGRGVKGDFKIIRELAKIIGAEVGATRVAVDEKWISKDHMVGQTGYVTKPKVALVFGVSGALQFTIGIQKADLVISVNEDPEAPIFQDSDYYVRGDLFQIIPPLIEELKKVKESEETTDSGMHKSRT
ncbi:MAG: electron transfer flavoprotein subunit alpha/FixB family protein [Elusimicrobia bacterium]|nr:electron transfer flavoprotein subunit alpha/FixB family protein [Elusimicrobiota bacterium]